MSKRKTIEYIQNRETTTDYDIRESIEQRIINGDEPLDFCYIQKPKALKDHKVLFFNSLVPFGMRPCIANNYMRTYGNILKNDGITSDSYSFNKFLSDILYAKQNGGIEGHRHDFSDCKSRAGNIESYDYNVDTGIPTSFLMNFHDHYIDDNITGFYLESGRVRSSQLEYNSQNNPFELAQQEFNNLGLYVTNMIPMTAFHHYSHSFYYKGTLHIQTEEYPLSIWYKDDDTSAGQTDQILQSVDFLRINTDLVHDVGRLYYIQCFDKSNNFLGTVGLEVLTLDLLGEERTHANTVFIDTDLHWGLKRPFKCFSKKGVECYEIAYKAFPENTKYVKLVFSTSGWHGSAHNKFIRVYKKLNHVFPNIAGDDRDTDDFSFYYLHSDDNFNWKYDRIIKKEKKVNYHFTKYKINDIDHSAELLLDSRDPYLNDNCNIVYTSYNEYPLINVLDNLIIRDSWRELYEPNYIKTERTFNYNSVSCPYCDIVKPNGISAQFQLVRQYAHFHNGQPIEITQSGLGVSFSRGLNFGCMRWYRQPGWIYNNMGPCFVKGIGKGRPLEGILLEKIESEGFTESNYAQSNNRYIDVVFFDRGFGNCHGRTNWAKNKCYWKSIGKIYRMNFPRFIKKNGNDYLIKSGFEYGATTFLGNMLPPKNYY